MKIRAWALAAVMAGALLSGIESNAEACSPPYPGLSGSIPANDETYPANAAVFLLGFGISLDDVTVTVDSAPATLKLAGDILPDGLGNTSVLVDPTPAAGQTVVLSGTFCPTDLMCQPQTITFVTSAPDTAAPEPPTGLTFDVHDYPDFKSGGGDCQSDSDLAYWVTTMAKPESEGGAPLLLTVEGFRDAGFTDLATTTTTFMQVAPVTLGIRMVASALGGESAPEALCFRATIQDAAGNAAAEPISACKPCSYRKDEEGAEPNFFPPSEPMWGVADIYPGGPCDAGLGVGGGGAGGNGGGGSDNGGGETDEAGGCGCRIGGGATRGAAEDAAGFMAMSLLGLGLARRRRARAQR
jgi:MYXO-CTERM domain-containing protein